LDLESVPNSHPRRISLIGAEREITCSSNQDVLNAAIRAGVSWMTIGCRGGGCGVCRVIVRSGDYVAGKMSKKLLAGSDENCRYALACRIYPASDLTIELAPVGGPAAPSLRTT
jgi:ferredoxin